MNQEFARFPPKALHCWLLLVSPLAFAQTSSFGQAEQGIATEIIANAKWIDRGTGQAKVDMNKRLAEIHASGIERLSKAEKAGSAE
jgi:hypothetical protein